MSKEAMKLALEALEGADWYINRLEMIVYSVDDAGTHENRLKVQQAITAIREALAEQPAQQQEPEIVQRVKRRTGKTIRTARNPNITARECIELADWIAANTSPPASKPPAVSKLGGCRMNKDVHDALCFALWHHQGGSSTIGQPIRKMLDLGQYDHMDKDELEGAKRVNRALGSVDKPDLTPELIEKMCPQFDDPMRREMWIIGFEAAHGIKGQP